MEDEILDIVEILESLFEDISYKAKADLEVAIAMLKKPLDQEGLIKVQDQLEMVTSVSNLDSYTRNEIMNVLSIIESLI
jgi:hypothetical protein